MLTSLQIIIVKNYQRSVELKNKGNTFDKEK